MTDQMTAGWASSTDELAQLQIMKITLESGARVLAGTVTLDELIADEALPDDLLMAAVVENAGRTSAEMVSELAAQDEGFRERTRDLARNRLRVFDRLALRALKKGGYSDGEAERVFELLDNYDRATLAYIAQRKLFVDAAGRRFGVEALDSFRGDDPEPASDQAGETLRGEAVDVPAVLEG